MFVAFYFYFFLFFIILFFCDLWTVITKDRLGAPFEDPTATGVIIGINYNTTREQLVTAVLESIGFRCQFQSPSNSSVYALPGPRTSQVPYLKN